MMLGAGHLCAAWQHGKAHCPHNPYRTSARMAKKESMESKHALQKQKEKDRKQGSGSKSWYNSWR